MQTASPSPSPTPTPTVTVAVAVRASPSPQGWLQRNGDQLSVGLFVGIILALVGLVLRRLVRRAPVPHADQLDTLLTEARSLFSGSLLDQPDYFRNYYTTTMQRLEPIHKKGIRDPKLRQLVGELLDLSRSLYPTAPGSVKDASEEDRAAYQDGYGRCESLAKRALERLSELRAKV